MTLCLERRQHPRFQVKSRVAVILERGRIRDIYHGDTCNLSMGGAGIFCDLKRCEEAESVTVVLFSLVPHLSIRARILQVGDLESEGLPLLRVAFTGFGSDEGVRLSTSLISPYSRG